jgi:hypothetical protein
MSTIPGCETSLVWHSNDSNPTLARFVAFAQSQLALSA